MTTAVLPRVTAEEDATLRRLYCLEQLGVTLSPAMKALEQEIRARDRRTEIRPPLDETVVEALWIT
jgi:imidazoleglycerol phosphate dehydratase HisB